MNGFLSPKLNRIDYGLTAVVLLVLYGEHGWKFFALDEGHSRLICFDANGRVIFQLRSPSAEMTAACTLMISP